MQDTSLDVWYGTVQPNINKKQLEIYQAIQKSPNHTAAEYAKDLVKPVNSISGRFTELGQGTEKTPGLNLIKRVVRRECNVTKGNAWTWTMI